MPDEILYFKTGSDRDRALLLYTLIQQSSLANDDNMIGLSSDKSFVRNAGKWIDAGDLSVLVGEPSELRIRFNAQIVQR